MRRVGSCLILSLCATSGLLAGCDEYIRHVPPEARTLLASSPMYGAPVTDDPAWQSSKYGEWFHKALAPETAAKCQRLPVMDRAAAALALADGASDGLKSSPGLTDFILWRIGVPYASDSWHVISLSGVEPHSGWFFKQAAERVKPWSTPCAYGVARTFVSAASDSFADMVVYQAVSFDPFPKFYKAGQSLVLSGHTNIPLKALRYLADAGNYERAGNIDVAADGTFKATIPLPRRAGRWMVQLETLDPACASADPAQCWPRTVADFPVYVDAAEPNDPADLVPRIEDDPDENVWPQRILTAFNTERARLHLKPLVLSTEIGKVAEEEADALYRDRRAAPMTNVAGRIEAHGMKVGAARQSAARVRSLVGWLAGQLLFPSHRARLLDPSAEFLGVASKDLPNGEVELVTIVAESPTPDVSALVQIRQRELAACVDAARQQSSGPDAHVGVNFSVSSAGQVADVVLSGAAGSLSQCVQDHVKAWSFDAHSGQTATFSVQLPDDLEGTDTAVAAK